MWAWSAFRRRCRTSSPTARGWRKAPPRSDLRGSRFAARLAERPRAEVAPAGAGVRRAAVAAILRWRGDEPEILLMERAQRDGDRWSGQVSMPGGREEP